MSLKNECKRIKDEGYYLLSQGVKVPVRIFMNPQLFEECEEGVFQQVRAATEFPGVTDVVLTPDAHTGYVVPVGCVMATNGTLCQAPVGYDIGCFRGDTRVPTVDGNSYPIADLAARRDEMRMAYSLDACTLDPKRHRRRRLHFDNSIHCRDRRCSDHVLIAFLRMRQREVLAYLGQAE